MFRISKKSIIIAAVTLICLVAAAAGTAAGVTSVSGSSTPLGTIVLDAGHGGIDGGVVGSAGVKESDINLAVTMLLRAELEKRGFKVALTRKDENSFSNIKREDMKARKAIIDAASPDAVVSIHVNKYVNTARRGAQVFYDDTLRGATFAALMQASLNTYINAVHCGRSNYEALAGDYYIVKCHPCPSIIIECGFISNRDDERLLLDDGFRKELVGVISDALEAAFGD